MKSARTAIVIFARAPEPGSVKKRLIPVLGAQAAARLHCRMTRRMVAAAVESGIGDVQLWATPDADHSFFQALRESFDIPLRVQRGADLGQRMSGAFQDVLTTHPRAILVGSDCPFLDETFLTAAHEHLLDGQDAILGPAADGGYVLLGLRRPQAALFAGIEWGGSEVLNATRTVMRNLGLTWSELPVLADVDRPEDLKALGPEWFERDVP